jgi:hypothetical protein
LIAILLLAQSVCAESLRIATYNAELQREGPGLLLRDILSGDDKQVAAVIQVIAEIDPDIILLNSFDYDAGLVALNAFVQRLRQAGSDYRYQFARAPNAGRQFGADLDRDGRVGEAEDAQGFGTFSGQGGMALLSKLRIDEDEAKDFSQTLWQDLPGATLPRRGEVPYYEGDILEQLRLSSTGRWDVLIEVSAEVTLHLLAFHHTTPAFDGPEQKNDLRNRDELRFWSQYMDQIDAPFVLLGDANLDPEDGDGFRDAMRAFLSDPRLQDPMPKSNGAAEAAALQGGTNLAQRGDPSLDTADWPDEVGRPGNLRVDYVLPSVDLQISASGVFWPAARDPLGPLFGASTSRASRHALVWVDIVP